MSAANHPCNSGQQDPCCCAAVSAHKAAVRGEQSVEMVVFCYMVFCDGTSCTALGLQASHLNSEEGEALDWYKTGGLPALHIRTFRNGRLSCLCTQQCPINTSCYISPDYAASLQMCTTPYRLLGSAPGPRMSLIFFASNAARRRRRSKRASLCCPRSGAVAPDHALPAAMTWSRYSTRAGLRPAATALFCKGVDMDEPCNASGGQGKDMT